MTPEVSTGCGVCNGTGIDGLRSCRSCGGRGTWTTITEVFAHADKVREEDCRMCGDEPDERSACPECGACWECASDDCGICCDRRDYKMAEQTKWAAERKRTP